MKIDRIIFCLNNNKLYTDFWNPFSEVWRRRFDMVPTLMFVGTQEELNSSNLSTKWGEIYRLDPIKSAIVDPNMDWSTTWAFFYGPTMFSDDVCLTMGIDQLSLTSRIFNFLQESEALTDDKYIIAMADAYKNFLPDVYPSGWHIAKGSTYKKILGIDDSWETEVKKVFTYRNDYPTLPSNYWALDELHSSKIINNYNLKNKDSEVVRLRLFHDVLVPRRLDRGGRLGYSIDILKAGGYSELHSPRPFKDNEQYITGLIQALLEGIDEK